VALVSYEDEDGLKSKRIREVVVVYVEARNAGKGIVPQTLVEFIIVCRILVLNVRINFDDFPLLLYSLLCGC